MAVYSRITIQMWFPLVVPMCSTIMMLGIPSPWEVIQNLKPAQASCTLPGVCLLLSFYTFCWTEPCIHFAPCWSGQLRGTLLSTSYFRESCLFNLMTTWYRHVSQTKVTLESHLRWDEVQLCWWKLVVILYILPWDNFFPPLISSEPSSVVGMHWSITT